MTKGTLSKDLTKPGDDFNAKYAEVLLSWRGKLEALSEAESGQIKDTRLSRTLYDIALNYHEYRLRMHDKTSLDLDYDDVKQTYGEVEGQKLIDEVEEIVDVEIARVFEGKGIGGESVPKPRGGGRAR